MTLREKCISVNEAATDISLRSKSIKTALIATIWTAKNAHFVARCHQKAWCLGRASASLCQQFSQHWEDAEILLLSIDKDSTTHFWLLLA